MHAPRSTHLAPCMLHAAHTWRLLERSHTPSISPFLMTCGIDVRCCTFCTCMCRLSALCLVCIGKVSVTQLHLMYRAHCAGHTVQGTLYRAHCAGHTVQGTLCRAHCAGHTVQGSNSNVPGAGGPFAPCKSSYAAANHACRLLARIQQHAAACCERQHSQGGTGPAAHGRYLQCSRPRLPPGRLA